MIAIGFAKLSIDFHGHRIWIFFFLNFLSLQVGLCFNWRWWARSWWIGRLFSWISLGNFETLHCITQLIHCTADLPIPIAFLVGRPLQWVKQRHIILNEPNALKKRRHGTQERTRCLKIIEMNPISTWIPSLV